jgi:hypothetical protein
MDNAETKPRFLTKSHFMLALECPTKLYYTGKNDYANTNLEDDFLKALADGGFQVGEFAKLMYPNGQEITSTNYDNAIKETQRLIRKNEITLFEAAICHENLYVRIDILQKSGNEINLIEVKAKSFDSTDHLGFRTKSGKIVTNMLPYLQDVAFQRHVISLSFPHLKIHSYLMLPDKSKICSVDNLNQKFRIHRDSNGRTKVQVESGTNLSTVGDLILTCVNVDSIVDEILQVPITVLDKTKTLAEFATTFAEKHKTDQKINPKIGSHCSKCEFRTTPELSDKKSGFHECWRERTGLSDKQINEGTVLDIWNFRGKQGLMDKGVFRLKEVTQQDLNYKEKGIGIGNSQRQWMQVSGEWPDGGDFYFDRDLFEKEMQNWTFPLHFIDFETARVAIPFFSGLSPYTNIAFQFSHHELQADGSLTHKGQFLSTTPSVRQNYEFVRQLKKSIGDQGTVFIWGAHESTTLNAILVELKNDPSPPEDAKKLRETILELTSLNKNNTVDRCRKRAMVDLCKLASHTFFHPLTNGSSSIKKVLPAVMQSSSFLKEKYSQPIYGASDGIPSLNFKNIIWWIPLSNGVQNPYKLLDPVFNDLPPELVNKLESDEEMEIAEGGAATTAYARLQFEDLSSDERKYIEVALLRYCELDTLAMVMIYQAWSNWLKPKN